MRERKLISLAEEKEKLCGHYLFSWGDGQYKNREQHFMFLSTLSSTGMMTKKKTKATSVRK